MCLIFYLSFNLNISCNLKTAIWRLLMVKGCAKHENSASYKCMKIHPVINQLF